MSTKKKRIYMLVIIIVLIIGLTTTMCIINKDVLKDWTNNIFNKSAENSIGKVDDNIKTNTSKLNTETVTTKTGSKIIIINEYDKSMFEGKKSLVFFWASTCPHCIAEMEIVKETMKNYANDGFNIYAISHDSNIDTLVSFMEKQNIEFNVYFDKKKITRYSIDPSANTLPLLYVINEDISIGRKNDGPATKIKVEEFVNYIKNKKIKK